jgi:hypothetical protein
VYVFADAPVAAKIANAVANNDVEALLLIKLAGNHIAFLAVLVDV